MLLLTFRDSGAEMLLLLEMQVKTLPRSPPDSGPTSRVFCTTWL